MFYLTAGVRAVLIFRHSSDICGVKQVAFNNRSMSLSKVQISTTYNIPYKGPFTNDVSREGEGGGYPNSDAVREVA